MPPLDPPRPRPPATAPFVSPQRPRPHSKVSALVRAARRFLPLCCPRRPQIQPCLICLPISVWPRQHRQRTVSHSPRRPNPAMVEGFPTAPKSRHCRGARCLIVPSPLSSPLAIPPVPATIVAASGVCLPGSCSSASPPPPSSVPQSPAHPHDANLCDAPPLPYRQLSSTSFPGHHPYLSHPGSCARGEGGGGS
jgi:hypothetical protein